MAKNTPAEFRSPGAFRSWLKKNHSGSSELIVRLYRVHAADKGLTYRQALDEALCFGWIDGVRRSLDGDSFTTRFSPRRPRSTWSNINVRHVQRLINEGRMERPGLAAFNAREKKRTGIYSFEQPPSKLPPAMGNRFRAQKKAWAHFQSRAPWYKRVSIFWVMSAKREETRETRLAVLIACSGRGEPIPVLARAKKSPA